MSFKQGKAFTNISNFIVDLKSFFAFLRAYIKHRFYSLFVVFEKVKDVVVDVLYKQRGKYTKPFLHFGTIALTFLMVTLGPIFLNSNEEDQQETLTSPVLSIATAKAPDFLYSSG